MKSKDKIGKSKKHLPLSDKEEVIGEAIVEAAFRVHRALGPGLLERGYEVCFCHELKKLGHNPERQVYLPIVYDGLEFDEGLRIDVLVDNLVIAELKAAEGKNPVWEAQLLSHMRLTEKRLGHLINFNVARIKNGIDRFVL